MTQDPAFVLPGAAAPRRPEADNLPGELYLETTNRCNLRCRTCPQAFGLPEPSAELAVDAVARIIAQVPRLERVVLHGIGEPTLHPGLPAIVRLVRARAAYTLLNTNATVLSARMSGDLVEAGLDELRVSIDAATPETYAAVRGVDRLGAIQDNLRVLLAERLRCGAPTPAVSLWMTATRRNIDELAGVVRIAAELGIPRVYLQRLVSSERGLATRAQSLHGVFEAEEPIGRAEALAAELGVALFGSGAGSARASLRPAAREAPWRGCRRPWSLMYVTANGNVLPCCIAPFTTAPYDSLILGNLHEQPLAEVWNGPRYRGWRAAMLEGESPEACRDCGTAWTL